MEHALKRCNAGGGGSRGVPATQRRGRWGRDARAANPRGVGRWAAQGWQRGGGPAPKAGRGWQRGGDQAQRAGRGWQRGGDQAQRAGRGWQRGSDQAQRAGQGWQREGGPAPRGTRRRELTGGRCRGAGATRACGRAPAWRRGAGWERWVAGVATRGSPVPDGSQGGFARGPPGRLLTGARLARPRRGD